MFKHTLSVRNSYKANNDDFVEIVSEKKEEDN
jgi:hypothetical protein